VIERAVDDGLVHPRDLAEHVASVIARVDARRRRSSIGSTRSRRGAPCGATDPASMRRIEHALAWTQGRLGIPLDVPA
jgi:hypothetical protein